MEKYNEKDGVWRTIGGRRVFIKKGQSMSDAMKESGKFKSASKTKADTSNNVKEETLKKDEKEQEEYVKENQPAGEKTRQLIQDSKVKTFADEIKEQEEKPKLTAQGEKKEFTRQELKDRYGTDDVDLINAGREKENRVSLKEKQIEEGKRLSFKAEDGIRNDVKEFTSGRQDYSGSRQDFIRDLADNWGVDKDKAEEIVNDELEKHPRLFKTDRPQEDSKVDVPGFEGYEYDKNTGEVRVKDYDKKLEEVQKKEKFTPRAKGSKSFEEHGVAFQDYKTNERFSDYLRDKYGTDDIDIITTGSDKSAKSLRDEFNKKSYDEYVKETLNNEDYLRENNPNAYLRKTIEDSNKKSTNDTMNDAIRVKASRSSLYKSRPESKEIESQGTSNRKEVSNNIQAHILDYYDSPKDFVEQMEAMHEPNMWRAGEKIAQGGGYLIYNGDMSDFLNELKINPKGKNFSEDKAFDMYTSLIGRESARLYEKLKKEESQGRSFNDSLRRKAYEKYLKEHPASKLKFNEFVKNNEK